ncbi:putative F-box protein At1g19160 isoform X1 [Rosa rugosa]|uniref:putative F-box protein At1g19160 isoform X1 n=1 Tax=Rosa rugosa TaxID=74645 RepID=UPI002B40EBF1|nr:putative F-box protein At1g19160 isoform X1 [Rosa rugosa]XP_062018438.1 putative F-box protein At1g19160 isoform X1 [Rosa rugosa]XP_062018439.1 putative F-box protein At1g19160 isoform X1 [Rosa rugosa]
MKQDEFFVNLIQRKSAGWFNVESAEDLLGNILSRLPVKLLLTIKVISKLWHRLICSPNFTRLHLSKSREKSIYILYPFMDAKRSLYFLDADGVITGTISLPGLKNIPSLCMIASYNGLICFTNYPWFPHSFKTRAVVTGLEIRICNPATREVWLLPNGSQMKQELGIGVAFGPGISEYRVLRFFCSKSKSDVIHPECEIFSSSSGTWRSLGFVQHCPMGAHHVFVHGKVFWFIPSEEDHNIPGSILSVGLDEDFRIIRLPVAVTEHAFLVDLEGQLSLIVVFDDDDTMVIWILKDENESIWEEKCRDGIPYETVECLDSVAARKTDIFFITEEHYFIFSMIKMSWKETHFKELFEQHSPVVFTYTESLLPCH